MNKNDLTRRQILHRMAKPITAVSAGSLAAVASGPIPAYGNPGKRDMDDIANAILKIYENRGKLA